MNKKILFLVLTAFVLSLPGVVLAVAVPEMITKIKDAFVLIGSSIVIIGWIIAGILYLTSAGSPEKLKIAKGALGAAVIGTVLIVLAVVIEATIKALLGVGV